MEREEDDLAEQARIDLLCRVAMVCAQFPPDTSVIDLIDPGNRNNGVLRPDGWQEFVFNLDDSSRTKISRMFRNSLRAWWYAQVPNLLDVGYELGLQAMRKMTLVEMLSRKEEMGELMEGEAERMVEAKSELMPVRERQRLDIDATWILTAREDLGDFLGVLEVMTEDKPGWRVERRVD